MVKMPNHNSQYNRKQEVEFVIVGIQAGTVRNEVKSVSCRFCSFYRRNEGQAGKRKRTNNLKFFRSPFLPETTEFILNRSMLRNGQITLH